MDNLSVFPKVPVPYTYIKDKITQHFLNKWQSRYSSSTEAHKTKVFFPFVDGKKIKKLAKESRSNLNILVQAGTGHALVADHISHWIKIKNECKLCEEGTESTEHLYFQCPRLELSRRISPSLPF